MKEKASKETEIQYQKDLCYTIIDFFSTQKEAVPSHWIIMMQDGINRVIEIKHLKALKIGSKKLIKMAREFLNEGQISQLSAILYAKFGITVDFYDKARIEKVIRNGKIKTSAEYELMFDYFEQIFQIPGKEEYIDLISSLLSDYQTRTGKV